jgi:hypothetical protein
MAGTITRETKRKAKERSKDEQPAWETKGEGQRKAKRRTACRHKK